MLEGIPEFVDKIRNRARLSSILVFSVGRISVFKKSYVLFKYNISKYPMSFLHAIYLKKNIVLKLLILEKNIPWRSFSEPFELQGKNIHQTIFYLVSWKIEQ